MFTLVDFIVYIVVAFVVVAVGYCLVLHCGFSFLLSSEFRFYSLDLGLWLVGCRTVVLSCWD